MTKEEDGGCRKEEKQIADDGLVAVSPCKRGLESKKGLFFQYLSPSLPPSPPGLKPSVQPRAELNLPSPPPASPFPTVHPFPFLLSFPLQSPKEGSEKVASLLVEGIFTHCCFSPEIGSSFFASLSLSLSLQVKEEKERFAFPSVTHCTRLRLRTGESLIPFPLSPSPLVWSRSRLPIPCPFLALSFYGGRAQETKRSAVSLSSSFLPSLLSCVAPTIEISWRPESES